MILKLFTVHDAKAEAYLSPFFAPTTGIAIRIYTDMSNEASHAFHQHPEDYTLFELGSYDDSNAQITSLPTPMPLGKALDYKKIIPEIDRVTNEHMPFDASIASPEMIALHDALITAEKSNSEDKLANLEQAKADQRIITDYQNEKH